MCVFKYNARHNNRDTRLLLLGRYGAFQAYKQTATESGNFVVRRRHCSFRVLVLVLGSVNVPDTQWLRYQERLASSGGDVTTIYLPVSVILTSPRKIV
jgi:hypothetical protein